MVERWISPLALHRLIFLGVAFLLVFLKLLPLPADAGRLPGPDLLMCLIFAWMVRRPEYLPVLMVAVVVFLEDILLMRPPGLWTGLMILASEFIRARVALTRELNFGAEWLLVAGLMLAMVLGLRLAYALAFLPQPALGYMLVQTGWSMLAYPVVVAVSRYGLDLHKPAMGELDAYGRRL
jgi:rod shape-determining protein MreD